ncbi:urease accessory protein [Psychrobacter sp. PL15]|uniref:HupE/UreJ family protein n=1 Tax=Psychrobacter sp. PL15 TaxID=3071719 RepID=UPI002E0AFEE8|nr:urease accessory protein [Psychrobacter sp. PL15]
MTSSTKSSRFSSVLSYPSISAAGSSALMALLLLPSLAQAHSGHIQSTVAHAPSFLSILQAGLIHPMTGLDHLFLAVGMGMLFYGLQKPRLGMRSLTAGLSLGVVLATVSALIGGVGLAASFGLTTGLVEGVILLSVVVLAVVLMGQWSGQKASSTLSSMRMLSTRHLPLLGISFGGLAAFHGMAHTMEVPAQIGAIGQLGFYAGMMVSMLGLYSAGMLINQQLQQRLGGSFWLQRGLVVLGLSAVFIPVLT